MMGALSGCQMAKFSSYNNLLSSILDDYTEFSEFEY